MYIVWLDNGYPHMKYSCDILEAPDFEGGLILRRGCTVEHVVSINTTTGSPV